MVSIRDDGPGGLVSVPEAIRYGVRTPAVPDVTRGPGITRSSGQDVLPTAGYGKKVRNAEELVTEGCEDEDDGEGDGDDEDEVGVTSMSTQRFSPPS